MRGGEIAGAPLGGRKFVGGRFAAFGFANHKPVKIGWRIGHVVEVVSHVVVHLHAGFRAALHADVHFVLGTDGNVAVHVADLFFIGGHGGPEFHQ